MSSRLACSALLILLSANLVMLTSDLQRGIALVTTEIFVDDFESYETGEFPYAGWDLVFNGLGTGYQRIVEHVSNSPTKSLQLRGSVGWAADAVKWLYTNSSIIGYEVYVMTDEVGVSNLTDGRVGFWEKTSPGTAKWYVAVSFLNNGSIYSGGQVLQPCTPGVWYKIKLIYDRENNLYSVWVDDVLRGEKLSYPGYDPYALEAFAISSQCFNDAAVYFDDVRIFSEVTADIIVPDDYSTIQEAINNAIEGDTIFVRNGTYHEDLILNKSLSLSGESSEGTIIAGNNSELVIDVYSDNVVLGGFTILVGIDEYGIFVRGRNCLIGEMTVTGDLVYNEIGIYLYYTNNITITNLDFGDCMFGIYGMSSNNNTILKNRFLKSGIYLIDCEDSIVKENDFVNEASYEIVHIGVVYGRSNVIYHNNFLIAGTLGFEHGSDDVWDNGCEGNYWSKYDGLDLDGDGIGDEHLPWRGVDNYPLMSLYWNPCDINHDLTIDMKDIGASAKAFATIPGDPLWNPHVDITGPEHLVSDSKVDMRDIGLIAKNFGETYS